MGCALTHFLVTIVRIQLQVTLAHALVILLHHSTLGMIPLKFGYLASTRFIVSGIHFDIGTLDYPQAFKEH